MELKPGKPDIVGNTAIKWNLSVFNTCVYSARLGRCWSRCHSKVVHLGLHTWMQLNGGGLGHSIFLKQVKPHRAWPEP